MPDRRGIDDNEKLLALIDLWQEGQADLDMRLAESWRRIRNAANRGTDEAIINRYKAEAARIARLGDIAEAITNDLIEGTDEFLQLSAGRTAAGGMAEIYTAGAQVTAATTGVPFSYTLPHRAAVEVLAQDTFDDVLRRTTFIDRDSKRFVRRVSNKLTGFQLTGGRTAKEQGRRFASQLEREFTRRGIGAVRYADGSRHGFGEYGEMLLRTKSGTAYNMGTINQGRVVGVQFYEILDGIDCGLTSHHDPDKAHGVIVPASIAAAFPLSHPNCRRSLAPRLDVTADTMATAPSVQSIEARRDQAAFERAYAREQAQAAQGRRRRQRRQRRARRATQTA